MSLIEQRALALYAAMGGDLNDWGKPILCEEEAPKQFNSSDYWEEKRKLFGFGEIFLDKKLNDVLRKQPEHATMLRNYCVEIDRYITGDSKGIGIIFFGPVGTMKTTMLWILAKAIVYRYAMLRQRHPMIRYVGYFDACNQLSQERFAGFGGPGYANYLANVDVLMMDDIAPFGIRPHEQEELFNIFDRRWMNKKVVFAASNQSEEWFHENLPQIRDRWNTSMVLKFDGASTRGLDGAVIKRLRGEMAE